MEQNQHPQTWDQAEQWRKAGELEFLKLPENTWVKQDHILITDESTLSDLRRKPALRPLTAEEIKRGPVEFWAAVTPYTANGDTDIKCVLGFGYSTKSNSVPHGRQAHFREVLPPLELTLNDCVAWEHKLSMCAAHCETHHTLQQFAAFLHARESARFEKGKV